MRIRSVRWKIEEQEDGLHDVRDWRRIVRRGMDFRDAARYVKKKMSPGDQVARIEPDGYAFDFNRGIKRIR